MRKDLGSILDGRFLNGVGTKSTLTDELLRWLVVDRGKSREFVEKLFEERRWQRVDSGHNWRLFGEDNVPGGIGVASVGQQAPVDVSTVSNVWVIILCRSRLQDFLYKTLRLFRPLEEKLYNRSENL